MTAPGDVEARERRAVALPPVPKLPEEKTIVVDTQSVVASIVPVRVQGGMLDRGKWLYVTQEGRLMTDEQIARESGGIVNARMDRGVRVLYGSGVVWGGEKAEGGAGVLMATKDNKLESVAGSMGPPGPEFVSPNAVDLLRTPSDLR